MEGHCSTGLSPQWAVVPMEEEEEDYSKRLHATWRRISEDVKLTSTAVRSSRFHSNKLSNSTNGGKFLATRRL